MNRNWWQTKETLFNCCTVYYVQATLVPYSISAAYGTFTALMPLRMIFPLLDFGRALLKYEHIFGWYFSAIYFIVQLFTAKNRCSSFFWRCFAFIFMLFYFFFFLVRLFNISNLLENCMYHVETNKFCIRRFFSFLALFLSLSLCTFSTKNIIFCSYSWLLSTCIFALRIMFVYLFNCMTAMQQNNNYYLSRAENLKFTVHFFSVCCVSFLFKWLLSSLNM